MNAVYVNATAQVQRTNAPLPNALQSSFKSPSADASMLTTELDDILDATYSPLIAAVIISASISWSNNSPCPVTSYNLALSNTAVSNLSYNVTPPWNQKK